MTLIIELTPEQEAQLTESARQEGLAPVEMARRLLTEHLLPLLEKTSGTVQDADLDQMSPEEIERALDEIAEMNRGLPVLPPEAFERESLYDERF